MFADLHNGQIVVITAMNADQPDATTGATFMALTAAQGTTFPAHGTDLGDWKLFESKRQVPALLSFAVQGDARSDLLVLAAPGVPSVDVSTMVVPTPTGALERQWQTLPLTDGVAWSKTGTTDGAPAGRHGIRRTGDDPRREDQLRHRDLYGVRGR